jgi:Na+/H+ antiporter NhaB
MNETLKKKVRDHHVVVKFGLLIGSLVLIALLFKFALGAIVYAALTLVMAVLLAVVGVTVGVLSGLYSLYQRVGSDQSAHSWQSN